MTIAPCKELGIKLDETLYPGMDLEELPSKDNGGIQMLIESFSARREYIAQFGFTLFTEEFLLSLVNDFENRGIESFVEIEAGLGTFTHLLNQSQQLKGVGYTLPINDKHWGMDNSSPFYQQGVKTGELILQDIREVQLEYKPDVIISSWIPYEGGGEVIEFFDNQPKQLWPDYYLVIGEGPGGCTASDEFFDWLEANWDYVEADYGYSRFGGIYDQPMLYKSKLL